MTFEHTCGLPPEEAEKEERFSGYLDGVLTQADQQKIRVRLDHCMGCRRFFEELQAVRDNARTTRFKPPGEMVFAEDPSSAASGALRTLGWSLLALWLLANVGFLLLLDFPQNNGFARFFVGLSFGGWLALLASVAVDRWKERATDRYRGVQR